MMVTLYQCTIFVDLALLAIIIAIFVFAVSIYKGALELCIKEQQNASDRHKELIAKSKAGLNEKMRTIKDKASINEVKAALASLDKEIQNIDESVSKFINMAKCLSAKNLVFIPSSLLITSIISSGIAIAVSGTLQIIMWIISLLFLGASLYFVCRRIRAIEFFSNFIDLSTLMEQALDKHKMKNTPIVDIDIGLVASMLEVKRGKTQEIEYAAFLKSGSFAEKATIRFVATEELDFPGEKITKLGVTKENMKNPKCFYHQVDDVHSKAYKEDSFKVKAPDTPGEYPMSYWILCGEYTGEETPFKIKVI